MSIRDRIAASDTWFFPALAGLTILGFGMGTMLALIVCDALIRLANWIGL